MAKPIVDGLEDSLTGRAEVIRMDTLSRLGSQTARRYGVRGLPTLVVLDGEGTVVLMQVGLIRPAPVRAQIDALLNTSD